MSRRRNAPVLILLVVGLAASVALGVLWPFGEEESGEGGSVSPAAVGLGPLSGDPAPSREDRVVLLEPEVRVEVPRSAAHTATTVLWPLRVELELVQAAYLPSDPDTPRIGSGATARLSGRAGAADGGFARVRVELEAGPNAGRVLHSDETGRFGATDLYPGLNVVKVIAESGGTARREVRTRQGTETQLNLGFGRLSRVVAKVQDEKGEGIENALVDFDGTLHRSGPNGIVQFPGVTAGHVLVEIEADGYTAHKELVGVTSSTDMGLDENGSPRLRFTLRRTGSLEVTVQPDIGSGPVQLFVLPATMGRRSGNMSIARNAGFPWHRINPIETVVGVRTTIDGLPAEAVKVYAFRSGARAPVRVVSIQPGKPYQLVVPLETVPKVSGRVLLDGEPVAGATVRLEAPNRVRATLAYFQETSAFLESAVLPELPAAVQELTTKANGRFSFTAWADLSATRYLEAVGPKGKTWAGRFVRQGEDGIDLELEELEMAGAVLALDPRGRFQGLPAEVFVDGRPQDPFVLPSNEMLVLEGLREGTWRLKVDWHGEFVDSEDNLVLGKGRTTLSFDLPEGAIHGQDEDTWRRAGKEFPFGSGGR